MMPSFLSLSLSCSLLEIYDQIELSYMLLSDSLVSAFLVKRIIVPLPYGVDSFNMALSLGAPHIDPSLYNWRPSTENPNLYTRRALGVETKWARQALGTRQMFLGGSFSLTSPYSDLTLAEFGRAAERASLKLRSEFPEVILRPSSGQGEDGSLLLELSIPESDGEATEWAKRSLFLDTCEDGKSVEEELRQAVIEEPVGLRLNARVDQEGKVAGAEFAFRSDHMTTDGVGAYILAGYFFKFLAHAVGGREETFDWDAMKRRIPIPWIDMMNSEQSIEGKIFEEGIKVITNLLIEAAVCILATKERGFSLTWDTEEPMGDQSSFQRRIHAESYSQAIFGRRE